MPEVLTEPRTRTRKPLIKIPGVIRRVVLNSDERQDELQKQHAKELKEAEKEAKEAEKAADKEEPSEKDSKGKGGK
jgi:hypothetical protein